MKIATSQFRHLAHLLESRGETYADSLAYQYLDDEGKVAEALTFSELHRRARSQAALIRRYTEPGDRVMLMAPTQIEFMIAFFAGCLAEIIVVPVFPPRRVTEGPEMALMCHIVESTDAKLLIAPREQLERIAPLRNQASMGERFVGLSLEELAAKESGGVELAFQGRPEDAAMILFTSGSTGSPKGVVLSHENLMNNFMAFCEAFDLSPSTPICTWLPNSHIAGIYTRLVGLVSGSPTFVFSPHAFLNQPSLWLSVLSKYRIHMSAAPNFAYDLCARLPDTAFPEPLDLKCWRMAISGGEVVQAATVKAFSDRYRDAGFMPSSVLPYFGMTETLCTTIPRSDESRRPHYFDRRAIEESVAHEIVGARDSSIGLVSNGTLLGDTKAVIVDPESHSVVEESCIGELWLRGSSITGGYWRRSEINDEVCQARLQPDDGHRYFRTGDLGFFRDDELFLTGRLKDLIIINGKNYYPTDIETSVCVGLHDGVATTVAAFPFVTDGREQVALAIESDRSDEASIWADVFGTIRKIVKTQHGVPVGALVLLPRHALPRTRSGKIQRSECRRLLSEGVWRPWIGEAIGGRTSDRIEPAVAGNEEQRLREIVSREISIDDHEFLRTPLDALGIDSIGAVRIMTQIFRVWGVQVDYTAFSSTRTIADLAEEIRQCRLEKTGKNKVSVDYHDDVRRLDGILDESASERATSESLFLTGATGFLGGYLLRDLLRETEKRIVCLVRADSPEAGRERLLARLASLGWTEVPSPERLSVVCGSLDAPRFGLSAAEFEQLSVDIGSIVHNGADVNFVAPYSALYPVNVASNLEILRLATQSTQKPVHYVSTIGVFNGPDRDQFNPILESDRIPVPDRLFSGYSQTKWVGEQLYWHAHERGLPIRVYRPGLVMGDSATGDCHTDDFLCRFLKGCLQGHAFPDLPLKLDMTPVDYVSQAITHLVQQGADDGKAFHLMNPRPISLTALSAWFASRGFPVSLEPSERWHERLADGLPEENVLFPLTPFLQQPVPGTRESILPFFAKRGFNLDSTNTERALRGSGIHCPPIDETLLQRYLDFFCEIGFLEMPKGDKAACLTLA